MCVTLSACGSQKKVLDSLQAGGTGSCELPDMSAEN